MVVHWSPIGIPIGQSVSVDITLRKGGGGLQHISYFGNTLKVVKYTLSTGTWEVDNSLSYGNFSGISSVVIKENEETHSYVTVGHI